MDTLQGIQELPGQTAGEKFKRINLTARDVADKKIKEVDFPKQLQPLLDVEVAKLSGDTDVIVKALLSSETLLCHRALQIPDLFTSDDSPLLNWEYFYNQLLSQVSFTTRCKIIKKLETNLQSKDPKVADEFYLNISKIYGEKQAGPLLLACSEELLLKHIQNDVYFPHRIVNKLFKKCPTLVIKSLDYFCSAEKGSRYHKNCHYSDFNEENASSCQANRSDHPIMSVLIDDYFDVFVSYCESKPDLSFTLGKRRTKLFLKKGKLLLIEKPKTFLRFLRLKVVTNKLTTDEFSTMMSNYFDKKMSEFSFDSIQEKLKFFPREKKVSITSAAFKKAYGEDLYDHPDLVDHHLLTLLPTEMRFEIAKLKLEKDSDWKLQDLENSWRVYLTFDMIFEDVKEEIAKRSDPKERKHLMELLIFCCKQNEDTEGVLEILKYIQTRLTEEEGPIWVILMDDIELKFGFDQFRQEHFDSIIDIWEALMVERCYLHWSLSSCLSGGVRFKLRNKLDFDEYLAYKIQLLMINERYSSYEAKSYFYFFNRDNLELQKLCLDKSVDFIMSYSKPSDDFVNEYKVLDPLFEAINEYEQKGLPLVLLDDHPKLLALVESGTLDIHRDFPAIRNYIMHHKPELYKKLTPGCELDEVEYVKPLEFTLDDDLSEVISNWEAYKEYLSELCDMSNVKLFMKSLRWYQDLPIKIKTYYQSQVNEGKFKSLEFLGLFMKSTDFQELIERSMLQPLINKSKDKGKVKLVKSFRKGLKNTSTPIPLTFFRQFFDGDDLHLYVPALEHTASRTPTPSLIDFVLTSINHRVSVVRKLINLVSKFAPIDERFRIYRNILHSNSYPSIHGFLLLKSLEFIRTDAREEGFDLFTECIEKKLTKSESILNKLAELDKISDKHLERYVKRVMPIFEKVQIQRCPHLPGILVETVLNQLTNIKYSQVLSVEYQLQLIRKHILEEMFDDDELPIEKTFIFDVFLHGYDERRIDMFLDTFKDYATANYGLSIEDWFDDDRTVYPVDELLEFVVINFVSLVLNGHVNPLILERLLELFKEFISPYSKSCLFLIWAKIYIYHHDPKEFGIQIGQNLEYWLSYCPGYVCQLVRFVEEFLEYSFVKSGKAKECFYSFFNSLLETKTEICYIVIAMLLKKFDESSEKDTIVEQLKKTFPSVLRFLYYK